MTSRAVRWVGSCRSRVLSSWSDFECKFVTFFRGGCWAVVTVWPTGGSRGAGGGGVLSIGKLGAGQQSYYLDAVASGVEDYYGGRGEVAGRWVGAGAETLGLSGVVDGDALRAVLEGRDPGSGVRLGRVRSDHVPGFDLTFRAPKSVSVLFGLGGFEISAQVRDAHDARWTRRWAIWNARPVGRGAARTASTRFRVTGSSGRRSGTAVSRAGDPHLHTHVLVANVTRGADERWGTLDARHLYLHAKTAGYLYEAHLRVELTERLGVAWGPVVNGIADVAGIPDAVLRAFSTRRVEIEGALAKRGASSARAAEIAALDTRKAKDYRISAGAMTERWRTQAEGLGLDTDAMDAVVGRSYPGLVVRGEIDQTIGELIGADGLTAHASSFDRRDVLRAWCAHFTDGETVTRIEEFADETIAAPQIVPLRSAETASLHRRWSGRRIQAPALSTYSTAELLALEQRVIDRAATNQADDIAVAGKNAVREALRARPELSDEQTALVVRLTTNGHPVDVVVAAAGTGKTFALDGARDAWQQSGHRVIGTALAARAAAELEVSAGIPSQTIASLLADLDNHDHGGLPRDAVVIVDEAGMVGTRTLARLIDHATAAHAKVVLVGDPRQLPEIDAGGVLRGLAQPIEPIRLAHNRRQHDPWEREALRALRAGDVSVALGAYDAHDRVLTAPTADGTRELMVADWWAATLQDRHVLMVAARHYDVDDLNARARTHRQTAGHLTGPTLEVDGRPYQAGDRIMTLRNQRRLGVRNGTFATITAIDIDQRAMTIRTDQGTIHQLPAAYLDAGHVRHAYATTIHKAQGSTVDQALVLGNDTLYQEAGYVALSRGRKDNRIYLVEQPEREHEHHTPEPNPAPLGALTAALRVSHAQALAVDRGIDVKALERKVLDFYLHNLCDERRDLERIARGKPHNPAADIRSLERSHDQLASVLRCEQARLDELTGRHPIRHRRERAAEQLRVEHAVENLQRQLDHTDHALDVARGQQPAYDTYTTKYRDELKRRNMIGNEIDATVKLLVASYRIDPPAYLATLGPYPNDANGRWYWDDTARTVEHYRHQHHITDQHQPLGQTHQHDHQQQHARERLQQAHQELTHTAGRETPGLEIEL